MANFGQLVLTNVGIQEQYKAQSGNPLKFKRIGMGSGRYSGNITALTKLVTENVSVDISKGYMQNNAFVVEGFFSNEGLQTGFAWREIGLFVEDEDGNEVLYCYANAGDTYDYIPATADERYSKYIRIATAIGNATNVSIVENEGILYVDTVTFNTAVEELKTDVDQLWPSKEISGSVIAVSDSAEKSFIGMNIYGKSEQIATNGYQIFDASRLPDFTDGTTTVKNNGDGSFTISGDGTSSSNFSAMLVYSNEETLRLLKKGTLTVKAEEITSPYFYAALLDGNSNIIQEINNRKSKTQSITITETLLATEGLQLRMGFYAPKGDTIVRSTIKPMLYMDGDGTFEFFSGGLPSPSPEYSHEIKSVGDNFVTLNIQRKNLLKISMGTSTVAGVVRTVNADGTITLNGTSTEVHGIGVNADIKLPDGKYILSGGLSNLLFVIWGKDKYTGEWKSLQTDRGEGCTFEADSSLYSCYLAQYQAKADTTYKLTIYPMIRSASIEDDTFEAYEAPQRMFYAALYGLRGIPVSSGGNYTDVNGQQWLCDEIDFARGVYVQRIKKVILNGTESWQKNAEDDDNNYLYFVRVNDVGSDASLCDKLIRKSTNTLNKSGISEDYMGIYVSKSYQVIYLNINTIISENTVDGLKSTLSENNLTVYYPLAEPIETALTSEQIAAYKALTAYNPCTTVMNDADAEVKVKYITKTFEDFVDSITDNIKPKPLELYCSALPDSQYLNFLVNAYKQGNVVHLNLTHPLTFSPENVSSASDYTVYLKTKDDSGTYSSWKDNGWQDKVIIPIVMMCNDNEYIVSAKLSKSDSSITFSYPSGLTAKATFYFDYTYIINE